jgi:hypothetical protein
MVKSINLANLPKNIVLYANHGNKKAVPLAELLL